MRKRERVNKKYSAEFKLSVILDMLKNYLSQRETIRKMQWCQMIGLKRMEISAGVA